MKNFCLALLIGFAFCNVNIWADEDEERAIKAIEGLKGKVSHIDGDKKKPVSIVNFGSTQIKDDDLKHLAVFKELSEVSVLS